MSQQIWYLRVGEQRGRPRIWIDGARLLRAGVQPGQPMDVEFDDQAQVVRVSVGSGCRKVSQRKRNGSVYPVIDISNDTIAKVFGEDVTRVRVAGSDGRLEISIHPDEAAEQSRLERGSRRLTRHSPLLVGSIFHGLGVLDHAVTQGLADAGIPTRLAWAVEAEPKYLDASLKNNPAWQSGSGRAIQGLIEEVARDDLPKVDLLVAGIPCTGASLAGRAKNSLEAAEHHESAGSLFVPTLMAIQAAQPSCILLENVPPYAKTLSMHVLRSVLNTWGYTLHETILSGLEHGALEDRDRLAVVAVSRGLSFDLDWIQPFVRRKLCLGDVLDPIGPEADCWKPYAYLRKKEARDRAAGKGFRMSVLGPEAERVGTLGRGYAKVRGTEAKLAHPDRSDLMRQFTPAEHARIKGIPERLVAGLPATLAHEALGQSVIFPAFRAVGRALAKIFRSTRQSLPAQPRPRTQSLHRVSDVPLAAGMQMPLAL